MNSPLLKKIFYIKKPSKLFPPLFLVTYIAIFLLLNAYNFDLLHIITGYSFTTPKLLADIAVISANYGEAQATSHSVKSSNSFVLSNIFLLLGIASSISEKYEINSIAAKPYNLLCTILLFIISAYLYYYLPFSAHADHSFSLFRFEPGARESLIIIAISAGYVLMGYFTFLITKSYIGGSR